MRFPFAVLALGLLFLAPFTSAATRTVAYEWDTAAYFKARQNNTGTRAVLDQIDGRLRVTVPPGSPADGYYNFLLTPAKTLVSGKQYTAVVTFEISTPTTYPGRFYLFARNTAGENHDIWQQWIGDAGASRTISMPLDLPVVEGGAWTLHLGMHGPGSIIFDRLVIYDGIETASVPAVTEGTAASTLPPGVTAATGFVPFTLAPPATKTPVTLSLANYKFVPDSKEAAATNALQFQQALKDCRAQRASTLVIPPGTYRFAGARSIVFDGLEDLTIDAQGAVFIIQELARDGGAFVVRNCARMVIKNLVIDWDWDAHPIASLGVVSNLSADKKQCDLTFPDLDAAQTALTRVTPWKSLTAMDPVTLVRTPAIDPATLRAVTNNFRVPPGTTIAAGSAANVLHATFPSAATLRNGQAYFIRHLYYEMGAFKVSDSSHLVFNSVTIRSIPGMGWVFVGSTHDVALLNCHIKRAPGSRTPLTTAADGIHIGESQGNFIIRNCTFTGMGDDVINLHDNCYEGELVRDPSDPAKLTLINCKSHNLRMVPGDHLQFYDADYSNLNRSAAPVTRQVAAYTTDNKTGLTKITFTSPLPAPLSARAIIRNTRFKTTNVLIADCVFEYANGRGILLSTHGTTVENCRFTHVAGAPIRLETNITQPHWAEGHGASNILIRNNVFDDNNQSINSKGAIIWGGVTIPWGPTETALFETVTIENNRFVNCPGPAVFLSNAANVIIRGNHIDRTRVIPGATPFSSTLHIARSSGLALGGNTWKNTLAAPFDVGVVYDPATTTNFSAETNTVTTSATGEDKSR
ncbi:MAG: right-handed parallel beta-helix repeat-containing protein [Rariglobus sp.]|nr:right-handed parallel beta-helix repeat-containing protein [Rariglobus sp.]